MYRDFMNIRFVFRHECRSRFSTSSPKFFNCDDKSNYLKFEGFSQHNDVRSTSGEFPKNFFRYVNNSRKLHQDSHVNYNHLYAELIDNSSNRELKSLKINLQAIRMDENFVEENFSFQSFNQFHSLRNYLYPGNVSLKSGYGTNKPLFQFANKISLFSTLTNNDTANNRKNLNINDNENNSHSSLTETTIKEKKIDHLNNIKSHDRIDSTKTSENDRITDNGNQISNEIDKINLKSDINRDEKIEEIIPKENLLTDPIKNKNEENPETLKIEKLNNAKSPSRTSFILRLVDSPIKAIVFVFGTITLSLFLYSLYICDFNLSKTEHYLVVKFQSLFGDNDKKLLLKKLNSQFETSLSPELNQEIATYFIQYDIDKENGFRKSDALDLIEDLGFSKDSEICKDFMKHSRGRTMKSKLLSGCSLQELGSLIENLIEESITTDESNSNGESLDSRLIESKLTAKLHRMNFATDTVNLANLHDTGILVSKHFVSNSEDENSDNFIEDIDDDIEILENELDRSKKKFKALEKIKNRRELSEIEKRRISDIVGDIEQIKVSISKLRNKN